MLLRNLPLAWQRVFIFTLEPLTELFALTATRVSVKRTAGSSGRKMFLRVPFTKKHMIQAIQLFWVVSTIMQTLPILKTQRCSGWKTEF